MGNNTFQMPYLTVSKYDNAIGTERMLNPPDRTRAAIPVESEDK